MSDIVSIDLARFSMATLITTTGLGCTEHDLVVAAAVMQKDHVLNNLKNCHTSIIGALV